MAMIETINLTKKYGELVALDNLNLTIEEGACLGFIGPNGAGKTTTIKILATLLKPTWGEARVDGHVVGYQNHLIRPGRRWDRPWPRPSHGGMPRSRYHRCRP